MKAGCELLEPYYKFRLEIPDEAIGRAMSDLQMRSATFEIESASEGFTVICGRGPVSTLHDYTREVISFTRGNGRLFCTFDRYEICHNSNEIIASVCYDPEADLENTPHSVFCAHGAGFVVPWQEVDSYKHLDAGILLTSSEVIIPRTTSLARKYKISDEELEAIMLRATGPIKRPKYSEPKVNSADKNKKKPKIKPQAPRKNMVIVDGYNLIYSWDNLKEISAYSLEKARETLMDILSNYVAYTKVELVLVFDAYLVKDGEGSDFMHDNYRVVYTRQDQTADAFIEKMMHNLGPDYTIRMVSGDKLLQFSAVHSGISRMTAKEFYDEVVGVANQINDFLKKMTYNL